MEAARRDARHRKRGEDVELEHAEPLHHAAEDGREGDLEDGANGGHHLDERHCDLEASANADELERPRELAALCG